MTRAAARLPLPLWSPGLREGSTEGSQRAIRRILVVEDDWLIALEIEAALAAANYEVLGTAVSASEAVAMATTHDPDLVIMDVRLQGARDGVDAAVDIYDELGIRSLFISANDDPATRKRAEAAKPAGWLSKPFLGSQLVAVIKTL